MLKKNLDLRSNHDLEVLQILADALVEVRSNEEILSTLGERVCGDGLPFMPEMFAFCG
jgi:hypothetical protein